jgi:HNH endonuclease
MRRPLWKHPTVRLHGKHYRELRAGVLQRDGWRCQMCGSFTNLTVHHQQYRSHSGGDLEHNLITLCASCHSAAHQNSRVCRGFIGYGDAHPSNVSPLMHGAEMRVAETRAVSRALRKAYGIGICSVEELGSTAEPLSSSLQSKKPS